MPRPDNGAFLLSSEEEAGIEAALESYRQGRVADAKRLRKIIDAALGRCRMRSMGIEELEAAALKLEPKARARLAGRLLDSLEDLSPEENARVWAEEAQRRADALDAGSLTSRSAEDVFREASLRQSATHEIIDAALGR
jgi:hypothetical protein